MSVEMGVARARCRCRCTSAKCIIFEIARNLKLDLKLVVYSPFQDVLYLTYMFYNVVFSL